MAAPAPNAASWAGVRVLVLSPTPSHPQDYGNRKRIFQVCASLKAAGAHITFAHYPAELEWRTAVPRRSERAMVEMWDQYYTIPPARALHPNPIGVRHAIDEWWDESIGDFLRWLFAVQSFDVFIVNYSWLSKALELAPRSVLKILDTHDKVSGRREVLVSIGLEPEFFFTSEAEEVVALGRADLVWAIKEQERLLFEKMSDTPVLTLPHLDPLRPLPRPEPDPDGFLRVGVVGARNNINRVNIGRFLEVARPVIKAAFAPIRIMIAGSICDLLADTKDPFVQLVGRVDDVEAFYALVDCAAIPMQVSTGMKIKTGEAISLGMPVVSLAHAFEGYEPTDRLHGLADYSDLAQALVDLSFSPRTRLVSLAGASLRSHAKTSAVIAETLAQSRARLSAKRHSITVAVDSRAFTPGTIFNVVLTSMFDYLSNLGSVTVLVAKGSAADVVRGEGVVDRFRRVVVAADLDRAEALGEILSSMGVDVTSPAALLAQDQPKVLVVDALHPDLMDSPLTQTTVMLRTEMIAASEGRADFPLSRSNSPTVFTVTPKMSAEVATRTAAAGADFILAPCLWRSIEIERTRKLRRDARPSVALLGRPDTPAMALAMAFARAWRIEPHLIVAIGDEAKVDAGDGPTITCSAADDYIFSVLSGVRPVPRFAVDLSEGRLGLGLCRELLERLRVPLAMTAPIAVHRSLQLDEGPLRATSEIELWEVFRAFAMKPGPALARDYEKPWAALENDGGWARIWQYCSEVFELNDQFLV